MKQKKNNVIKLRVLKDSPYFIDKLKNLWICCVAESAVYGAYITASGNQKRKIPMQLEATVITIISLLVLHGFGIYGAAISFLLAAIHISYRYTTFTLKLLKSSYLHREQH